MKQSDWCVVLGGGGAKGVYHLGVWQALRELGIRPRAFFGCSIGAIFAACMALDQWEAMNAIVRNMSVNSFFRIPTELVRHGNITFRNVDKTALQKLIGSIKDYKGFDTQPLRNLIEETIDEQRLRASGMDYGLVTLNLSDLKPCELTLEEIPAGTLIDYLMASSALPGLKPLTIDQKHYLDGGLHDNIPFALARRCGYTKIIVVDVSGIGLVRRFEFNGCRVVHIKNSLQMGSILDFSPEFVRDYSRLGYLDTLRAFGRLAGESYFLVPASRLERQFAAWIDSHEPAHRAELLEALPQEWRQDRRRLLRFLEAASLALGLPRIERYAYGELARLVLEHHRREEARIRAFVEEHRDDSLILLEELLFQPIREKRYDGSVYFYFRLTEELSSGTMRTMLMRLIRLACPSIEAALVWLRFGSRWRPI